jgi:hypothetical protein
VGTAHPSKTAVPIAENRFSNGQHPEGMTRSQVIGGRNGTVAKKNTVSSALYNLKKSRRLDLSDGRYRVA